jgi:hypothetical protein
MARISAVLFSLVAVSVAVVSAAQGTPGSSVTIVTAIDFSTEPPSGTFTVPVGSGALGCSGGTFVDAFVVGFGGVQKNLTCTNGSGAGDTFVIQFHPTFNVPGPGDLNGPWSVQDGSGDFAKLHGAGDFSVVFTGPASGVEMLTGSIHFD